MYGRERLRGRVGILWHASGVVAPRWCDGQIRTVVVAVGGRGGHSKSQGHTQRVIEILSLAQCIGRACAQQPLGDMGGQQHVCLPLHAVCGHERSVHHPYHRLRDAAQGHGHSTSHAECRDSLHVFLHHRAGLKALRAPSLLFHRCGCVLEHLGCGLGHVLDGRARAFGRWALDERNECELHQVVSHVSARKGSPRVPHRALLQGDAPDVRLRAWFDGEPCVVFGDDRLRRLHLRSPHCAGAGSRVACRGRQLVPTGGVAVSIMVRLRRRCDAHADHVSNRRTGLG
mmetsp:Transcript_12792/g.36831  ORF Transcript_12792/g.36831 Transcript_12792/m.36831 type:complete len:286 (+) Transcript_12792:373-1230(+)